MDPLNRLLDAAQAMIDYDDAEVWDLYEYMVVMSELREAVAAAREGNVCVWKLDESLLDYGLEYETACGEAFAFFEEGPQENHHRFCPGCSRRINVVKDTKGDKE